MANPSRIVARSPASNAASDAVDVHVEARDRVAEIVGEVARLGVPSPAELEGLRHRDRLVAEPNRVDQRGASPVRRAMSTACVRHRQALVDVGVPCALDAQQGRAGGRGRGCPHRRAASSARLHISTRSRSTAPMLLFHPRLFRKAAPTRTSTASMSSASRPAASSVSRCAGSPVCRWASPNPRSSAARGAGHRPRPGPADRAHPGTSAAPRRVRAAPAPDRPPVARTRSPCRRPAAGRLRPVVGELSDPRPRDRRRRSLRAPPPPPGGLRARRPDERSS